MAAALFLLLLACMWGFAWRSARLDSEAKLLDARGWYTPDEAAHFLCAIGESGRTLYAITELSLDMAFPVAYGLLLAILIVHLYRSAVAHRLIGLPFAAGSGDIAENVTIAYLAWSFDGSPTALAWLAAVLTAFKTALIVGSLLAVLLGVLKPSGVS